MKRKQQAYSLNGKTVSISSKKGKKSHNAAATKVRREQVARFKFSEQAVKRWDLLPACQLVFIHPIFNFRVMTATLDTTSMYNNFSRFQLLSWLSRRRVVDAKVLPGTPYLHQSTTAQLLFQVEDLPPCLNRSLDLKSSFLGGKLIVFWTLSFVCLAVFVFCTFLSTFVDEIMWHE